MRGYMRVCARESDYMRLMLSVRNDVGEVYLILISLFQLLFQVSKKVKGG